MAAKRSSQLVIIGVSVFVIGAGLVFLGLRSSGDSKDAARVDAARRAAAAQKDTSANTAATIVRAAGQNAAVAAVPIPKGMEAVALRLDDVRGLSGYAKPGDVVNVYAAVRTAGREEKPKFVAPWAKLILPNVTVLDVVGPPAGVAKGEYTFLLALSSVDAEKVIFFSQFEKVWVTLVPKGQPDARTPGIDLDRASR